MVGGHRFGIRFNETIGWEVFIKDGDHEPSICLSFSTKGSDCSINLFKVWHVDFMFENHTF
jgi:hypothetical protein